MKNQRTRWSGIVLGIVVTLCSQWAFAGDIAWVVPVSETQTTALKTIVAHALWRDNNRFLIELTEQQKNELSKRGLASQIVAAGVSASDFNIIFPGNAGAEPLDNEAVRKGWLPVGGGCYIAVKGSVDEKALSETITAKMNSLDSYQLRIIWIPDAVASFLHEAVPSDTLANRVKQDSLYAFNRRLELFQTRYIWSDSIDAVEDWLVQQFLAMGYAEVSKQPVWYQNSWHYNIMAVKPGYAEPDAVIVIGGHFDSIVYGQTPGPLLYAPGSDDNGSGTAAILELARILADVPLRKTIIFMPFTAEEVGLIGSKTAAETFANDGTHVEVMFNMDMIGFTANSVWDINLSSGRNGAYRELTATTGSRVTSLIPLNAGASSGSSDHASFNAEGFAIVFSIETDFNYTGWHTNLDLTSRMNFPYMTDVVKMIAATVGYVADAASPTTISHIADQGDGQSLEVFWSPCVPSYAYTLYVGNAPGEYYDTIAVPLGQCSHIVTGLQEGVETYLSVTAEAGGVYPAVYAVESSGESFIVPRVPAGATVEPAKNSVIFNWSDNTEADFSHYRIYRNEDDGAFGLYKDLVAVTSFFDSGVVAGKKYGYQVAAVDTDNNESSPTTPQFAFAATFDQGVLVVDEITQQSILPVQSEQEAWISRLLDTVPYALTRVDAGLDAVDRSVAGRHTSILWLDDDLGAKMIALSDDSLRWYLQFNDNMLVAGLRTLRNWSGYNPIAGDVAYDEFRISHAEENPASDFAGAVGENGWPSIKVRSTSLWPNALPTCPKLEILGDAQVIYRWNSFTDDPAWEGQPCGVLYNGPHGYRIFLGFPLWFLTESSAKAVIQRALLTFGERSGTVTVPGDADGNGSIDVSDLVFVVNYLFKEGALSGDPNAMDVNSDCRINVLDIVRLVSYLFKGGQPPYTGCVD